jgi:rubredoxin
MTKAGNPGNRAAMRSVLDETACAAVRSSELGRIRFYSKVRLARAMKKYMCLICGHIYDEALGDPDTGIAPGTKWEDVPPNWTCPDCGARKEDYELIEF